MKALRVAHPCGSWSISHRDDGVDLVRFEQQINRLQAQRMVLSRLAVKAEEEGDTAMVRRLHCEDRVLGAAVSAAVAGAFNWARVRGMDLSVEIQGGRTIFRAVKR